MHQQEEGRYVKYSYSFNCSNSGWWQVRDFNEFSSFSSWSMCCDFLPNQSFPLLLCQLPHPPPSVSANPYIQISYFDNLIVPVLFKFKQLLLFIMARTGSSGSSVNTWWRNDSCEIWIFDSICAVCGRRWRMKNPLQELKLNDFQLIHLCSRYVVPSYL